MIGMEGRLSRESDGVTQEGEALVRSATGWARQTTAGGRVDAVACETVIDGEEQVGKLVGTGGVIPAKAGEAVAIGDLVTPVGIVGRFGVAGAGDFVAGVADTVAAADGDMFSLILGGGIAPLPA